MSSYEQTTITLQTIMMSSISGKEEMPALAVVKGHM